MHFIDIISNVSIFVNVLYLNVQPRRKTLLIEYDFFVYLQVLARKYNPKNDRAIGKSNFMALDRNHISDRYVCLKKLNRRGHICHLGAVPGMKRYFGFRCTPATPW